MIEALSTVDLLPALHRAVDTASPRGRLVAWTALELCERLEETRAAGLPLWGVGREIDRVRERLEKLLAGSPEPEP